MYLKRPNALDILKNHALHYSKFNSNKIKKRVLGCGFLWLILRIHISSFPNHTAKQTGRPPCTQKRLRYPEASRKGVAAGTFVQGRSSAETTVSAVMRQSLHLKRRDYVLRYRFSLWDRVEDVFRSLSATNPWSILTFKTLLMQRYPHQAMSVFS